MRSLSRASDFGVSAGAPDEGRYLLKLRSNRRASGSARLRAAEFHWVRNSWGFAAGRSAGCNSAKVSSLKRKYAVTKRCSRMAAPVKSIMDARSDWFGGARRTSPSPSKKAPVTRPATSSVKAMVPSSKVMCKAARSSDTSRMLYTRDLSSPTVRNCEYKASAE